MLSVMLNVQVENRIQKGPHEDLENYLQAVDQLRNIGNFFGSNKTLKRGDGAANNTSSLLAKAILKLEEEFKELLNTYRFV